MKRYALCLLATLLAVAPTRPARAQDTPAPLSLLQAKRIALRDNPGLEAAAERVQAAAQRVRQALAAYHPTLYASLGAQYVETQPPALTGADIDPFEGYSAQLTAQWLLFDGLARRFTVQAARAGTRARKHEHADAQRLLLEGVATTYLNSLLARENTTIANQDAAFNEDLSRETQKRYDAGAASRSEVLNFRIRTTQARAQVVDAEQQYRTAMTALAALLGRPQAALLEGTELPPLENEQDHAPPPNLEAETTYALAHRPDLLALGETADQLERQRKALRANYLPTLAAEATLKEERIDNPRFQHDRDGTAYVGALLSWDLYTGGLRKARIQEQNAALREIQRTTARLRIDIIAALRSQIDVEQAAREQVALQRQVLDMTREARDLVRAEYLAGRASLTRLNEAQTDLVRAAARDASARILLRKAREGLAAASARILQLTPAP